MVLSIVFNKHYALKNIDKTFSLVFNRSQNVEYEFEINLSRSNERRSHNWSLHSQLFINHQHYINQFSLEKTSKNKSFLLLWPNFYKKNHLKKKGIS
jgi:hypothetical protein